jgi:hypothetical protein
MTPRGDGTYETCVDGVPFRVVDLRPKLERLREFERELRRQGIPPYEWY